MSRTSFTVLRQIPLIFDRIRETVAPVSGPGATLGVRRRVQHAVQTMRTAASSENAALRLELARQAVLELNAARAETTPPLAARVSSSRHAATIAKLSSDVGDYEALAHAFAWLERRIETHTRRELVVIRAFGYALAGKCQRA